MLLVLSCVLCGVLIVVPGVLGVGFGEGGVGVVVVLRWFSDLTLGLYVGGVGSGVVVLDRKGGGLFAGGHGELRCGAVSGAVEDSALIYVSMGDESRLSHWR